MKQVKKKYILLDLFLGYIVGRVFEEQVKALRKNKKVYYLICMIF